VVSLSVRIQRTITILLADDADLRQTLSACQELQRTLSPICYNQGTPLGALALQRVAYHVVKGKVSAQMTCSAIRLVSAAYVAARSNGKPATRPFAFRRKRALFLVGQRGRDADFRQDGTLSIWTVAGRKRIPYTVPAAVHQKTLSRAVEIDSLTLIERKGQLQGRVTVTLEAPDPKGVLPVGIDLNETNAVVAVDASGRELFISGRSVKIANQRTRKTRTRLQKKLAARKAETRDTRSVRRALKRLGRKQRNRNRDFARKTAKELVTWVPENAVLVFEELNLPQPEKRQTRGKALRRRLSEWQRLRIREAATCKAQEWGILVAAVDPAYTSQCCSRCGLKGSRRRHRFCCPHCGLELHADVNAAINIRNRYTALRCRGHPSVCLEALGKPLGKPLPFRGGGH
jgi:putative transposase